MDAIICKDWTIMMIIITNKIPIPTKGNDMVSHFIQPFPGILVLGGYPSPYNSVEFWSTDNPGQDDCLLNSHPRTIHVEPSANFVAGQLVTCMGDRCEIYNNGAWSFLVYTRYSRNYHSSAQTEDRILLIGGSSSYDTEWISLDGSASLNGPFTASRHTYSHCTIQLSPDLIVVTGGQSYSTYVTEYHLTTGVERGLTRLNAGRHQHACGVYHNAGQQV